MDVPVTADDPSPGRWDPRRILGSTGAVDAIRSLGGRLRAAGFINRFGALQIDDPDDRSLVELALGRYVDGDVATDLLGGTESTDALILHGGADRSRDGRISLGFEVLSDGWAMAIAPFLQPDGTVHAESVYSGTDTWLLRDQAWRYGLHGTRAVELGTGTGLVAAFLTARFTEVVATDITSIAIATARLGSELLDGSARRRLHFMIDDVAGGLRPASFDFVCVNAPWVPTGRAHGRLYADGGETGFELPRRFIADGVALLAPGGVFIALCTDLVFTDGRAPLRETLARLDRRGFATLIESTPRGHPFHRSTDEAGTVIPGLASARHVTVVVRRRL